MKIFGLLKSGEKVTDRPDSHVAGHASVLPLLEEALRKVDSKNRTEFCEEVCFDRNVGETICVETNLEDEILFAMRVGRKGPTRFVKNRAPEPTNKVTICLHKSDGGYMLGTAFIGSRTPAEPWDEVYRDEHSIPFWDSHALIWGRIEVVPE